MVVPILQECVHPVSTKMAVLTSVLQSCTRFQLSSIREGKTAAMPHNKEWSVYSSVEQLFPDYVYLLWHKTWDGRSAPHEYKPTGVVSALSCWPWCLTMSSPSDGGKAVMHGLIKGKGCLWPTAVLLHIPQEEGEEIISASHLGLSLASLLIQVLELSRSLWHQLAAELGSHRYHHLLSWAVTKSGDDGGGSFSHGVHLTRWRFRCTWVSEPDIRGAKAGNFYIMESHDTSVAWEWNPSSSNQTISNVYLFGTFRMGKGVPGPSTRVFGA